jgi:NitT/TauT family transport system substrate-binding protein
VPAGIVGYVDNGNATVNSKGVLVFFGLILVAVAVVIVRPQYWRRSLTDLREGSLPLRLGTNVWPGYEPFYLARRLGHFDERDVRLVEYSSASHVIRAFRNGTIELAALTLDEVLLLKETGMDVRVILVLDISDGADVILGRPDVSELSELRGRKIAVERTALGAYVLTRALQSIGMQVSDVNVVSSDTDEHERVFQEGQVDAVVTFEPIRSRLIANGAITLFDSSQIPGEIVDVLAVSAETLETEAVTIESLLHGWFLACRYLQTHPEDASQSISERMQLEPQQVLASFSGLKLPDLGENMELFSGPRPKLTETAENLAQVMWKQNLLPRKLDLSRLLSSDPLKRVSAR